MDDFKTAFDNLDRLACFEADPYTMEKHLAEKPDVLSQPGAFNRWLARQPDIGTSMPPSIPPEIIPPEPTPKAVTEDNVKELVKEALAEHDEIWHDAVGAVIAQERKSVAAELAKLELRFDAQMRETTNRQAIAADVERREAEVIGLLRRSQRHG
ncbi:hypothetical protein [Bradyrhizobium lablabi]|uniref:hypothetical protein n=1 Tax=Bradyrhizobium lablabi TaxID=722472 RepID=UPI001BACFF32|nr:hypothetical protein [Bradyrhizobium lablabi]MBR0695142.1 hypothetical protein [Bradyrhizobium lablabi]